MGALRRREDQRLGCGAATLRRRARCRRANRGLLTRSLHLSKGQLVDVEGRLQTRTWDDAGKRRRKAVGRFPSYHHKLAFAPATRTQTCFADQQLCYRAWGPSVTGVVM
jgi:hypothetical protein